MQIDNSHNLLVTSHTVPDVLIEDAKTPWLRDNDRKHENDTVKGESVNKRCKHPWPLGNDGQYENDAVKENLKSCSKHTHTVVLEKKKKNAHLHHSGW